MTRERLSADLLRQCFMPNQKECVRWKAMLFSALIPAFSLLIMGVLGTCHS